MKRFLIVVLIAAAFLGGYGYGRWYARPAGGSAEKKPLYWVDPMHPWYKSDKPGIAPDCNMALVPVYPGEESKYNAAMPAGMVEVTPEKQQLIGVQLGTAEYQTVSDSIRAAARVTLDETRISKVQSKLEGWIDRVFVDFTGKYVKKGDPLLTIYSPEALATQLEYLLALKNQRLARDSSMHERMGSADTMVAAARKRLELWDISAAQIDEIGRTGQPLKNLTLYSRITGYVMERNAYPNQRITGETALYTVADLSKVWAIADVYEYEAAGVRVSQPASLTVTYLPGRTFRGKVNYILPQVDPNTRTLKVRIEFDNPNNELKADAYGEARLQTTAARKLVVPRSAVMNSGDRQIVFIDHGSGRFEPRQVTAGQEYDGRVEIVSGLQAGERIVTSGNFLLDSESQLNAAMSGAAARKSGEPPAQQQPVQPAEHQHIHPGGAQ